MKNSTAVCGVGMIPFAKPGESAPYFEMGRKAAIAALQDAGIDYDQVQQAYVGYVYGDSTCGQRALYGVGQSGIPVINVNNNCSTGSTALYLARQAIETGAAECVLALGFEQMKPGALASYFDDRPSAFEPFDEVCDQLVGHPEVPMAIRYFGGAGMEHMKKYGTSAQTFAKIRAKASRHASKNPLALFQKVVNEEEVMNSPSLIGPLTRLMACPPTCGAAAAVLCSEDFAKRHGLNHDVRIVAQAMTTDSPSTFDSGSIISLVGADMTRAAADQAYAIAGIGPEDLDLVELHDCFATNELITYEGLGLAAVGEGEKFVMDGDNTYGGRVVTNPSGGLLSKGHPLGATGLAQCTELVQQLQGRAGERQVSNARTALQHNLGLGGACVVTIYQKAA